MKTQRVEATVRSVATQRDSGGSALQVGDPAYFPTIDMPVEAWRAWLQLQRRLIDVEDAGHPSPCRVDPGPFTSEDRAERTEATLACRACPALFECAFFAWLNGERAYVWAGVDMTPRIGGAARHGTARDELAALLELEGGDVA